VARPLRLCFEDARYHVISRGTGDGAIYLDETDRKLFLVHLRRVVERHDWLCHAYCLMTSHYHLAVETPRANLPVGMQQLNGAHASGVNERHGRHGHLFGSRYRSILIEDERYLLAVCRYIVLNPIRAGICAHLEDWPWSSYRATAGLEPTPPFLTTEVILGEFGTTYPEAQAAYREFVAAGVADALHARVRGERLGGDGFLRRRFGIEPPLAEIPRIHIEPERTPLAELFAGDPLPVARAYRSHGYSLREIAEHLGCHYSTVSRRLRREEEAFQRGSIGAQS
jgi:REP-associated tyrosine transposase